MKTLTLWDPWGSLIILGPKKVETRPWATRYRGPLAIHVSARMPKVGFDLCIEEPFYTVLSDAGYNRHFPPAGCVIGFVDMEDCQMMAKVQRNSAGDIQSVRLASGRVIDGDELFYGHYEEGRYAWILSNPRRIDPIPAVGRQKMWDWDAPAQVLIKGGVYYAVSQTSLFTDPGGTSASA